jgi:hypothetical protein
MTYRDDFAAIGESVDQVLAAKDDIIQQQDIMLSELRADLAECREGNTPPASGTVFGTSRPDNTPGVQLPVPAVRTYLSTGQRPTTVESSSALRRAYSQVAPDGQVWLSIKEEAGAWLSMLIARCREQYPNVSLLLTSDHEPYDGWYATNRVTQWQGRQDSLEATMGDTPGVTLVTVMEGWHNQQRSPGYWDAMYREEQQWGVDSYNPGIQTPKAYVPPADVHGDVIGYAASKGKIAYIGETGTGLTSTTTANQRSQWVTDNHNYLDGKVNAAYWWNAGNDGPTGSGCKLTATEMGVWLGDNNGG